MNRNMCRTCLGTDVPMSSFYESVLHDVPAGVVAVPDFLTSFVRIAAYDRGFPDQLCDNCMTEIQRAYSFKLRCEESEQRFREQHRESAEAEPHRVLPYLSNPFRGGSQPINVVAPIQQEMNRDYENNINGQGEDRSDLRSIVRDALRALPSSSSRQILPLIIKPDSDDSEETSPDEAADAPQQDPLNRSPYRGDRGNANPENNEDTGSDIEVVSEPSDMSRDSSPESELLVVPAQLDGSGDCQVLLDVVRRQRVFDVSLEGHMRRFYSCTVCSMRFTQPEQLAKHREETHPSYYCSCGTMHQK